MDQDKCNYLKLTYQKMETEKLFEEKTTEAAKMQFSLLCMYSEVCL